MAANNNVIVAGSDVAAMGVTVKFPRSTFPSSLMDAYVLTGEHIRFGIAGSHGVSITANILIWSPRESRNENPPCVTKRGAAGNWSTLSFPAKAARR